MTCPAAQKIRNTLVREVLDDTSIASKREQWENSARIQPTPPGVVVRYLDIGGVPCLLCVPEEQNCERTIVYCHGGGLVEGSVETFRVWTARLALHTGCQVLSVDYRLAPEHPHPAAIEDVLVVCRELLDNASYPGGISIGADSTGCIPGLAALLNLQPVQGSGIKSAFFLSPSIDLTFSGASIIGNASLDPLVSIDVLKLYAGLYAGNKNVQDPAISPLFSEIQDMPAVLIMVDEHEILLDDSTRLVQKILSSGGIAKLCVSQGLWHVWPCWGDFPESTIALENIRLHVMHPDLGLAAK